MLSPLSYTFPSPGSRPLLRRFSGAALSYPEDQFVQATFALPARVEEVRTNAERLSGNHDCMSCPTFPAMGSCVATGIVEGRPRAVVSGEAANTWPAPASRTR